MIRFEESAEIAAPAEFVFDLIHDYSIRLKWDPFLRDVRLFDADGNALPVKTAVAVGSHIRCTAVWRAGGRSLDCEYISFHRPRTAAIRMLHGPWFFHSFAARITTAAISESACLLTGLYQFECRPQWLAPLLGRVIRKIFATETRLRWRALREYAEAKWSSTVSQR